MALTREVPIGVCVSAPRTGRLVPVDPAACPAPATALPLVGAAVASGTTTGFQMLPDGIDLLPAVAVASHGAYTTDVDVSPDLAFVDPGPKLHDKKLFAPAIFLDSELGRSGAAVPSHNMLWYQVRRPLLSVDARIHVPLRAL